MRLTVVPRENKKIAYAKFGGTNKRCYGIFRNGLLHKRSLNQKSEIIDNDHKEFVPSHSEQEIPGYCQYNKLHLNEFNRKKSGHEY